MTAPLTINLTNRGQTWDLINVVFDDGGGAATGYFVYDPAAPGQYLAVNIHVTQAMPVPDPGQSAGPGCAAVLLLPLAERGQADVRKQWEHGLSNGTAKPGDFRPGHSKFVDLSPIQLCTAAYERRDNSSVDRSKRAVYPVHAIIPLANPCAPPPTTISQELFALPENQFNYPPAWYCRVIVSGSVRARQ